MTYKHKLICRIGWHKWSKWTTPAKVDVPENHLNIKDFDMVQSKICSLCNKKIVRQL